MVRYDTAEDSNTAQDSMLRIEKRDCWMARVLAGDQTPFIALQVSIHEAGKTSVNDRMRPKGIQEQPFRKGYGPR